MLGRRIVPARIHFKGVVMSFWKKALKKFKKQKKNEIENLVEDKYFNRLTKKLSKFTDLPLPNAKNKK